MGKGKNSFLGIFRVDDSDQDFDEEDDDVFDDDYDEEDSDESAFSGIGSFFANKKKEKEEKKAKTPNNFTPKIAESPKKETASSYAPRTAPSFNNTGVYQNPVTGNTVQTRKPMVKPTRSVNHNENLVSMNNQRRSGGVPMNEVFVIKPVAFDDAQTVSDDLKAGKTIIINMEGVEVESAQRIIDFIGGACYGLGGDLEAISSNIFIAAPNNIEITGDLRSEIINGALSPSLKI